MSTAPIKKKIVGQIFGWFDWGGHFQNGWIQAPHFSRRQNICGEYFILTTKKHNLSPFAVIDIVIVSTFITIIVFILGWQFCTSPVPNNCPSHAHPRHHAIQRLPCPCPVLCPPKVNGTFWVKFWRISSLQASTVIYIFFSAMHFGGL